MDPSTYVQGNSLFDTLYNDKCELEKDVLFNDAFSGYHYGAFVADKTKYDCGQMV